MPRSNRLLAILRRTIGWPIATALVVTLGSALAAGPADAATIAVNTTADDETVNGNCTLREAITALNTRVQTDQCIAGNGSVDKITLGTRTINLTVLKHLTILRSVILEGAGYAMSLINAGDRSLSILIGDGGANVPTVYVRNLTIRDTTAKAIFARTGSNVTLEYVRIQDSGYFTSQGSCVAIDTGATLLMRYSEIVGCFGHIGGGVVNRGTFTMRNSSIIDAEGEHGGAIANSGTAKIYASTLAKNRAAIEGAGVLNTGGTTTLEGVTISYNASGTSDCDDTKGCGTLFNSSGTINIKGSVVAKNTTGGPATNVDCSGTITSLGYNILGETASACPKLSTDKTVDPKLLSRTIGGEPGWPLDYGGLGDVYMLDSTSPAVNAVPTSNSLCNARDQRGFVRGKGTTTCDMGAIERSTALVVRNSGGSSTEISWDNSVIGLLSDLGFAVSTVDDDVAAASDASGKHLVFISESVEASKINSKFRDVSASVIVNEPSLYGSMRMTGTTEGTDFGDLGNQLNVTLQSQSIGNMIGALGVNSVTFPAFDVASVVGWGVPGSQASIDAMVQGSSTRRAMFTYWVASLLVGTPNFYAPGLRAGFFGQPGSGMNESGWLLFRAFLLNAAGSP
ncbi:MAG TPA: choice-of-anchor Q domain-containing protein [Polyangia bacterium]